MPSLNLTHERNGGIAKIYLNDIARNAAGSITSMKLGNWRFENATYNSRGQITQIGLGNSATDAGTWKTQYEYGELQTNGTVDAAKNTGNIAKQTLSFNGLTYPLIQSFKYDSLYRINEAKETANGTQNWIQNWDYDRYGNRTSYSQNIGGNTTAPNPAVDANTNRFGLKKSVPQKKSVPGLLYCDSLRLRLGRHPPGDIVIQSIPSVDINSFRCSVLPRGSRGDVAQATAFGLSTSSGSSFPSFSSASPTFAVRRRAYWQCLQEILPIKAGCRSV